MSSPANPHWQNFATGAQAHTARRLPWYRPDFRQRVVDAALQHWPEERDANDKQAITQRLLLDPSFRQELNLGPITWWLLAAAIKAILSVLVGYWLLTLQKTSRPIAQRRTYYH
ncbi:hypothetical protein AB1K70_19350 [Bremerella sp. JC770]|uniref:hypothetical protein n=1 Tax=Bremerella sp. JC770 TaxID=3232137 RepID=UPI003458773E